MGSTAYRGVAVTTNGNGEDMGLAPGRDVCPMAPNAYEPPPSVSSLCNAGLKVATPSIVRPLNQQERPMTIDPSGASPELVQLPTPPRAERVEHPDYDINT
ncbi:hypothetical protein GCM10020220_054580 [Nonomuraea rubra]